MSKYSFVEDLFLDVYTRLNQHDFEPFARDQPAADNFFDIIANYNNNRSLTEKQGRYLQKILGKYRKNSEDTGLVYPDDYKILPWKKPFRVIDETKSISIEQDEDGFLKIVLKMPFSLKEHFEKEIFPENSTKSFSRWDSERQVRFLNFYSYNLVQIDNFIDKHKFARDEKYDAVLAEIEQIWQDQEQIIPSAIIDEGKIILKNCDEQVVEYFESQKTDDLDKDKFLLHKMRIKIQENLGKTVIDRICDSDSTEFWIKNSQSFFETYKTLGGNAAVILNASKDIFSWTRSFVESAEKLNLKEKITVCYRAEKEEDSGFNNWIKENGLGGKIESNKIFIFRNKPAKWLFSENIDVNIILTNSLYPVPSHITQAWMNSHHCVMYLGDVKASPHKDKTIVEL
jgi:hypothetical protein